MGLFDFLTKKPSQNTQSDAMIWVEVAGKIAGTIWHLIQTDPKFLANPFTRVVLRNDWNVGIASDQCDPEKILGSRDVAFAFLREDQQAYNKWVEGLKNASPMFHQIETEQFAKVLTRKLREQVQLVD
jgi:hypothetical protein